MTADNAALLVGILTTILVLALSVNYFYHKKQVDKQERRLKARKLQLETEKLLEALSTLKLIDCPADIIQLLSDQVTLLLTRLGQLKPEQGVMNKLQSQSSFGDEGGPLNLENESSMTRIHNALSFAIRFAHQNRGKGNLSEFRCDELCRELQWLDKKLEIDVHFKVGKRMLEADKPAVALSHFKNAQTFIRKLPYNSPERLPLLTEANELIAQALPFGNESLEQEKKSASDQAN